MNAIEVNNVTKKFGNINALNSVSFDVKKGEVFGYLGPNGAGKTTTVRMLTGIMKPDTGYISIMGNDISKNLIKAKSMIDVLPEISNAYPDLSSIQNLVLIAQLHNKNKKEAVNRGFSLLKEFNLYDRRDDKVKTFSKGMKRRLMFCMSLISDPAVIFLDEPTSGLDVVSARMLRNKVKEIASQGKTIFLTSHDMLEVNQLCDRIAILSRGTIITIDTPDNIRAKVGGEIAVEVILDKEIELPGAEKFGNKYTIYTTDSDATIKEIVNFSNRHNIKIKQLNVGTPSLEEAFLKLTEEKR